MTVENPQCRPFRGAGVHTISLQQRLGVHRRNGDDTICVRHERLAEKLGYVPFDVMTGGLDQVLLRGVKEVDDDTKIKIVGRLRELGTAETNQFLKDLQTKWPPKTSPRVKQAIDQAVLATSASPGSSGPAGSP